MAKKKAKKKARKKVHKKKVHKKKVPKKKVPKRGMLKKPKGYEWSEGEVLVPEKIGQPVPASKLRKGFLKAKGEIEKILSDLIETMTEEYVIREIELNASFSADGKFMGFGVGGAASIKIKIAPACD